MSAPPSQSRAPLKPYETVLEQEVEQAQREISRPALGLFLSGVLAGFGVSLGMLLVAALLSLPGGGEPGLPMRLGVAVAYATGFVVVILGHTDLFTEYTTMAILPVLVGRARVRELARLWGLVFAGNLTGAAAFSALSVVLGPRTAGVEADVLVRIAHELVAPSWWVILLSASLTGWLMGLLSWLLNGARDTTSQILFITLIAGAIGLLGLHHSVTGTAEVLGGLLTAPDLGLDALSHFLVWTTLGNVAGGVAFAVLIRYSVVIGNAPGSRRGGDRERRGRNVQRHAHSDRRG